MNISAVSGNPYHPYPGILPVVQPVIIPATQARSDRSPVAASGGYGEPAPDVPKDPLSDQPVQEKQSADSRHHPDDFSEAEKVLIESLKQADRQIRRHEMAHVAAGGPYIITGANFSYRRGPDGINYAVAGEVRIDTAPVPGDPEATLAKMRRVKQAALAPADPSSQDIKVASMATAQATKAMADLMVKQTRERAKQDETEAFASRRLTTDTYLRVKNLPVKERSSFRIAG